MIAPAKRQIGCSPGQLFTGILPRPTRHFVWGNDISPVVMEAMRGGETAIAYMAGKPYALVLMDEQGTIRYSLLKEGQQQ